MTALELWVRAVGALRPPPSERFSAWIERLLDLCYSKPMRGDK
jgi:hypothetical protein